MRSVNPGQPVRCARHEWYARGLGAARWGDAAAAWAAQDALAELRVEMKASGGGYWAALMDDAQAGAVDAWAALAEGDEAHAVEAMRRAADLEDRLCKSPVTPGHLLPARELLGDMLLQLGRPEEARAAYEASLALSPHRRRSTEGLAATQTE